MMAEPAVFYQIATWLLPLTFAIVFHEIAHGWVALAFGDPTARDLGRLSPNPIRHIDPIGTVGLPLFLAVSGAPIFGWAKPVPIKAERLRNPRFEMMLVALAGPGMNLVLALAAAVGLAIANASGVSGFLFDNLRNFLVINIFLAIFNLTPLPPFDGGHVVEGLLPRRLAPFYRRVEPLGFPLVIFLLLILPMLAPELNLVRRLIYPIVERVLNLYLLISGPIGTG